MPDPAHNGGVTRVAAIVLLLCGVASAQVVEPEPIKTPFDQGRMGLSVGGGSQTSFGFRYFVVGAGFGYFVLDGLELGASAQQQFGDGPNISMLSPSVRYLVQPLVGRSPVIPYVGTFYKHWFIGSGYDDVDTLGGRAGLVFVSGQIVLGLGIVYERIVSECTEECASVYPDFTISLSL